MLLKPAALGPHTNSGKFEKRRKHKQETPKYWKINSREATTKIPTTFQCMGLNSKKQGFSESIHL
jgi:hypothetical protein